MATAERLLPEELTLQRDVAPPFEIRPASHLAESDPPPPRDWICEGLGIPAGRVTSMGGNGGFGKTTVATQIGHAVSTSKPLWGMRVAGGPVFGFLCEDEQHEVDRKILHIAEAEGTDLEALDNLYLLSRDGENNVLCTFDRDQIVLTEAYYRLDATVASIKPRLTIIDTAADVFAGDFMSTPHVRQFIKVCLGGLCKRHETAVLLLAHPSAAGIASGDGGGFSTAWNNSVRSRLYLRRPKSGDPEAIADRRVLEIRKSNYGPTGATIPLIYERNRFSLDPEPIEENPGTVKRAARTDTRLAMAVMTFFREKAANGQVVNFGAIFGPLQSAGDIQRGSYETVRKPLQRCLKELVAERLLLTSNTPRGYRLAQGAAA